MSHLQHRHDNFSMKLTQATLSIRNISGTFKEKIVSDHILGVKDYQKHVSLHCYYDPCRRFWRSWFSRTGIFLEIVMISKELYNIIRLCIEYFMMVF